MGDKDSEAPISEEMPYVTSRLVGGASVGFALVSIAILTAIATLDPSKLDFHLRNSAVCFGIAVPIFFTAAYLALWLRGGSVAYLLLALGAVVWGFGFLGLLFRISYPAGYAFMAAMGLCSLILAWGIIGQQTRHQQASKMAAKRAAEQHQQPEPT